MFHKLKFLLAVPVFSLLAACVGPMPKIDSSPGKLASIRTIAVIRAPEPKTYTVMFFGHPGMAFGLIGGLVAASDQNDKQERLSKAYREQGTAVAANLASQISAELVRIGYDARVEDADWEEVDGKFKLPYEKIKSDADAVLVISSSTTGFVSTGITSDYMPTIWVGVNLLGKDRKEPLYRGFHATGWQPKSDGWKFTPPTKGFANFDALMTDTRTSAKALEDATAGIAATVAADLKR